MRVWVLDTALQTLLQKHIMEVWEVNTMTSEAKKKSKARFDSQNTLHFGIKLNKRTDKEIIELLQSVESKQGLIRDALRREVERRKGNEE